MPASLWEVELMETNSVYSWLVGKLMVPASLWEVELMETTSG
ncbi:hypothetical protein CRC_01655 [Cylindrospermopsis raciborskii CS-505]|nr:hypothetical protein CRC_01655 [Cylindrospermopsis raciborskii CS-505]